jgi:hypothetical protein
MFTFVITIAVATMATGLANCGNKSPITILVRPDIAPAILDFENKTMYYRHREIEIERFRPKGAPNR